MLTERSLNGAFKFSRNGVNLAISLVFVTITSKGPHILTHTGHSCHWQWRLTHDASVYNGHRRGAVTPILVAERLAVELSVLIFNNKDEHWNRLCNEAASKLDLFDMDVMHFSWSLEEMYHNIGIIEKAHLMYMERKVHYFSLNYLRLISCGLSCVRADEDFWEINWLINLKDSLKKNIYTS